MMTLLVSLIVLLHFTNGFLQCENGNGDATDWWFAIRNEGSRTFEYFDSILERNQDTYTNFLTFDFATADNPIKKLLKPIREEANDRFKRAVRAETVPPITGYIAYNDQAASKSGNKAHAKGFIAWELGVGANQWKGYWLIHSQPYWPYFDWAESEYCTDRTSIDIYPAYRHCSIQNRQSFFCISLKTAHALKQTIKHIEKMDVLIYDESGARPAANPHDPPAASGARFGGTLVHFFNDPGAVGDTKKFAVSQIESKYGGSHRQWVWTGLNAHQRDTREHGKIGINKDPFASVIEAQVPPNGGSDTKRTRIERGGNHIVCVGDLNPVQHRRGTGRTAEQTIAGGGFMCLRARKLHQLIKNYYVAKGVYIISRSRAHAHATDNMLEYEDNTYVEYEYQNDKKWLFEYIYSYLSLLSIVGMIFFMVGLIASAFCGNAIQWILDSKMFT
eukprot:174927_1